MAGTLDQTTTSGHLSWQLGIVRLCSIRRRVESEGLTLDVAMAMQETFAELATAAVTLDVERIQAFAATVQGVTS